MTAPPEAERERDAAKRVAIEAMRLMSDEQLAALRHRLDELEEVGDNE